MKDYMQKLHSSNDEESRFEYEYKTTIYNYSAENEIMKYVLKDDVKEERVSIVSVEHDELECNGTIPFFGKQTRHTMYVNGVKVGKLLEINFPEGILEENNDTLSYAIGEIMDTVSDPELFAEEKLYSEIKTLSDGNFNRLQIWIHLEIKKEFRGKGYGKALLRHSVISSQEGEEFVSIIFKSFPLEENVTYKKIEKLSNFYAEFLKDFGCDFRRMENNYFIASR